MHNCVLGVYDQFEMGLEFGTLEEQEDNQERSCPGPRMIPAPE